MPSWRIKAPFDPEDLFSSIEDMPGHAEDVL